MTTIKSKRPTYNYMILCAYNAVVEHSGTSSGDAKKFGITRYYIKQYLSANYNISPTSPQLKTAIRRLLKAPEGKARLIPNTHRGGHYRPSDELKAVKK